MNVLKWLSFRKSPMCASEKKLFPTQNNLLWRPYSSSPEFLMKNEELIVSLNIISGNYLHVLHTLTYYGDSYFLVNVSCFFVMNSAILMKSASKIKQIQVLLPLMTPVLRSALVYKCMYLRHYRIALPFTPAWDSH